MADFISRLVERAQETTPVVQPLIASMFAPEPTTQPIGSVWDDEIPTSYGYPDRTKSSPTMEPPPAWGTPRVLAEDAVTAHSEEQGIGAPVTHPLPSVASDISPDLRRPAGSRASEHGITLGQEDQSTAALVTKSNQQRTPNAAEPGLLEGNIASRQEEQENPPSSKSPQRTPESRPGLSHLSEPASPERWGILVDNDQNATMPLGPSPGIQASLEVNGGTLGSVAMPDRSTPLAAAPLTAPTNVHPRLDRYREQGPREPRVGTPESSAPTIRVAIGRIEVRAITPPPTLPAQRSTPARPSPTLSLDDYLKQRNGGQR